MFHFDVSLFELPEYKGVPVLPEVVRPTISAIPYSPIIEEADVEMVNAYKHVLIHFFFGGGSLCTMVNCKYKFYNNA